MTSTTMSHSTKRRREVDKGCFPSRWHPLPSRPRFSLGVISWENKSLIMPRQLCWLSSSLLYSLPLARIIISFRRSVVVFVLHKSRYRVHQFGPSPDPLLPPSLRHYSLPRRPSFACNEERDGSLTLSHDNVLRKEWRRVEWSMNGCMSGTSNEIWT